MTTPAELRDSLIGAFPPGTQDLVDWDDAPGNHMTAIAQTLAEELIAPVEELAAGVTPLAASLGRIVDWERCLGLASSRTAIFGTLTQRRAQVVSRLRERGAPTVGLIQAVLAPLLGYADASQLVVLQPNRTDERTQHTYGVGDLGSGYYTGMAQQIIKFYVDDDAALSAMGAQADLVLTCGSLEQTKLTLVAPSGEFSSIQNLGRGAASSMPIRACFPNFRAARVFGPWLLEVEATGLDSGNVSDASLFVEGFGRDLCGFDGLSAALFEWAVVYEPLKSNGQSDIDAARAAIQRLTYGCRIGGLVFIADPSVGLAAGDYGMIPNDNATPGACVPNS
jgi:Uncharacterised protein conserved in bacteria (DUF2313)